ncbi:KUP/HAK/KT family potassium transporter [Caballeronia sp. EK]|uniref:KUP/HAK/KT family potassium transporter n=1 Tax=Caballeronia sp. EK TaxID=2767469 RepID=UPI0016561D7E|nr:KUP/HAK/KT family potassium transporter [Caballeronia sp. EK]
MSLLLVFPALVLNYFGQAALVLTKPSDTGDQTRFFLRARQRRTCSAAPKRRQTPAAHVDGVVRRGDADLGPTTLDHPHLKCRNLS